MSDRASSTAKCDRISSYSITKIYTAKSSELKPLSVQSGKVFLLVEFQPGLTGVFYTHKEVRTDELAKSA